MIFLVLLALLCFVVSVNKAWLHWDGHGSLRWFLVGWLLIVVYVVGIRA